MNSSSATRGLPDEQLLIGAGRGEPQAYEAIMRRYNQRMFRLAVSIVKDEDMAKDVMQEAYVKAFKGLAGFRGPQGFTLWLLKVAKNEALMQLRKNARDSSCIGGDDGLAQITATTAPAPLQPEANVSNQQLKALIEQAIDQLPDHFRSVFMLRGVEQMSIEETADIIGIAPETVKTRYHRARRLMQTRLARYLESEQADAYSFDGRNCDQVVQAVLMRMIPS